MTSFFVRIRALRSSVVAASILFSVVGCGGGEPDGAQGRRVVVLGFDGMDYELTKQYIEDGRLPNFARLAGQGSFHPLGTSVPPLSPVAWSNFITGMDSGGHGIFDFIHRDPKTMVPYLSTSKTEGSSDNLELGKWQLPLGGGSTVLLRQGEAFWEALERHGVPTTILRMPANFPPTGTAAQELSGMGTPDVLGTYGTFSFYTSELFAFHDQDLAGGKVYEVWEENGVVEAQLHGPKNPFLVKPKDVTADFKVYVDPDEQRAKLVVGTEERVLAAGEWSDWVPVEFELLPHAKSLKGICRFYLRRVRPEFELYVSPINFDPLSPEAPISTPDDYAGELAQATGRFYTQGMPEDVQALKGGVLTREEFLQQAEIAGQEIADQFPWVLDQFKSGLLFFYTGNVDQISHMMYRAMDPQHPLYDEPKDALFAQVIEQQYEKADTMVGYALDHLGEGTTLVVMSDHGFSPLRRRFSLNTWLAQNGYLALKNPNLRDDPGMYVNVDWAKTRAYGLGLNGLYVNLRGRERWGIVDPKDRDALIAEIQEKLLQVVDPTTGLPAVTKVYKREEIFKDRGAIEIGPDVVMGYARTMGGSDDSALGKIPPDLFTDNSSEWSGDHGMDHEVVPGIFLSNKPLKKEVTSLKDLAAAIVAEFGIDDFPSKQPAAKQ
ncbi:MAG: hypothetical protein HC897_00960 [Thermoanaerobaculia bacterium]|nr:hypothetical protein [Thermoanaerobaculia bacterium]